MKSIVQTGIWRRTLDEGAFGDADPDTAFRSKLRQAFVNFRERASTLAAEIPQALRDLTVHDQTHTDALWQLADMIIGNNYPITPTEAFVLGGRIPASRSRDGARKLSGRHRGNRSR